ncbi:unnamed protein product [Brassica oleracea var. botrytis]|uniref:RPM1 interacting protein 13 n=3 Tax=Brassica TaxID=3705 RepID=A0ABQ7XMD9_BRANA|nr:PREDICTED: uncharacterized protein LOC106315583 [Brassica oleracea var. oleracea]XP_013742401.1 uncharacterized protein LOC106445396 [Brassica napus]KAG2243612.1 hypothetical protein Bca52824_094544 [Brassica carinata]KAH0857108.1 hypothetical protein HID58_085369 [Brassica napus]
MGSENHIVVDVSSDEEMDKDYLNWLNMAKSDSTDEVEVEGSVDSQLNSSTRAALEDEGDEDCVILDCDPDKTGAAVEADDNDDEVLVVGQKGEVACRDFPHPRHSCAKYSFNSTSHESYCDMCHCYVCDIPAPCPYWCAAVSSIDHCHANDKDKTWMNQREYFRTQPAHATVSPAQSIIRLSLNPWPRNKIEIRPCSSSSSRVANLSNVNRGRTRVRQSLSIQKDRSTYIGNLRSRVASSGTRPNAKVSRSTPSVVAPTINPQMYTQQQQQQQRNCQLNVADYCQRSNADLFRLPEWGSQAETVQQQPATNENVLQTKLSEVESWLVDSCNQASLVSPLPEPVAQDNVTFDFETFLND